MSLQIFDSLQEPGANGDYVDLTSDQIVNGVKNLSSHPDLPCRFDYDTTPYRGRVIHSLPAHAGWLLVGDWWLLDGRSGSLVAPA